MLYFCMNLRDYEFLFDSSGVFHHNSNWSTFIEVYNNVSDILSIHVSRIYLTI